MGIVIIRLNLVVISVLEIFDESNLGLLVLNLVIILKVFIIFVMVFNSFSNGDIVVIIIIVVLKWLMCEFLCSSDLLMIFFIWFLFLLRLRSVAAITLLAALIFFL